MTGRKRYALVGCGGRGLGMFAAPLVQNFKDSAELAGICDINPGRMEYLNRILGTAIPAFRDFDAMMKAVKPDTVIVCTVDALHHEFIVKALERGCDVISEKPMTINEVQCRQVLEVEKRTGRKVTVTFNYRFAPYVTRVKELLAAGAIGRVISVDFNYQLDRSHGADYFRRWHRQKKNSGGLLVHKSTHHFDIVNWFLAQDPVEVFAFGSRQFYGPTRAERGENCRTCAHTKTCEFYFDINTPTVVGTLLDNKELYAKVEHHDGYLRDRCVFADDIDIEDTMTLTARYSGGTQLAYSLNAHCAYEGWRMALNGSEGRIEAEEWHSGPYVRKDHQDIRVVRWNRPVETVSIAVSHEAHSGGDVRLHKMLFAGAQPDPLGHMASSHAGAMSILTGIAANHSIARGQPVRIADLFGKAL